jgi:hypothetical protein
LGLRRRNKSGVMANALLGATGREKGVGEGTVEIAFSEKQPKKEKEEKC